MSSRKLLEAFLTKEFYTHPTSQIQVIETHISWVITTGTFAYKIKKPVNLGFADFSTLEKRKYFCHQEFQLNQLLAKSIYLEVLPLYENQHGFLFTPSGNPIEWVVKMREFSQNNLFSTLLSQQQLTHAHIRSISQQMAKYHSRVEVVSDQESYGLPETIRKPMFDNFTVLTHFLADKNLLEKLNRLETWTLKKIEEFHDFLIERKKNGFVRKCHGDLHLGNIVLFENKPLIFDCIEFNEDFRSIDIQSEIAFLAMDLEMHHEPELAGSFINAYLQASNDYEGLELLNFYKLYKALVRAKVAQFSLQANPSQKLFFEAQTIGYIEYGERLLSKSTPVLYLNHGFSGSGKSYISNKLSGHLNAIQIRSDIERKRLSISSSLYNTEIDTLTYDRLLSLSKIILNAGFSVIVDATFLKKEKRAQFLQFSQTHDIPLVILDYGSPREVLISRIQKRNSTEEDPSDADETILNLQENHFDSLTNDELALSFKIYSDLNSTMDSEAIKELAKKIIHDEKI